MQTNKEILNKIKEKVNHPVGIVYYMTKCDNKLGMRYSMVAMNFQDEQSSLKTMNFISNEKDFLFWNDSYIGECFKKVLK